MAGERLSRQLHDSQVDAAIDAGLMGFVPCPACAAVVVTVVREAQQRLHQAWASRDRYLARNDRLARQARERVEKRRGTPGGDSTSLPSSAAAALARARSRAQGGEPK